MLKRKLKQRKNFGNNLSANNLSHITKEPVYSLQALLFCRIDIPQAVIYNNYMRIKAFSLIEVLITMAVIGVIAVLVLPNVSRGTSKKTYATQLNEVHRALAQAINQVMLDERETSLANTVMADSIGDFMKKYLQIETDCGTEQHSQCIANSYKSLDGSSSVTQSHIISSNLYCVKTVPGAVICMHEMTADKDGYHGSSQVIVDINGKKAPNTNGRDLFQFEIYSDGRISNGYEVTEYAANGEKCRDYAGTAGYGGSCFQRVKTSGWNMDY